MSIKIAVLSGGFDPLHEGHIAMFREAKKNYDKVFVGVNSDEWLIRKKGKRLLPLLTRLSVLQSIKYVDEVFTFDDSDNTATDLLYTIQNKHPFADITFGNGGDRSDKNYPELDYCLLNGIHLNDTLGGAIKRNSSSELLTEWSKPTSTERSWGSWSILKNYGTVKVKELVIQPHEHLSWQKHSKRSELWFIKSGTATLLHSLNKGTARSVTLNTFDYINIPVNTWHTVFNNESHLLVVVEIQYGDLCVEDDITRCDKLPIVIR